MDRRRSCGGRGRQRSTSERTTSAAAQSAPGRRMNRVAPFFFDGWYHDPGRHHNQLVVRLLQSEQVDGGIPLGPDNFIVPKEYDGRQPHRLPIVVPERLGRGRRQVANVAAAESSCGCWSRHGRRNPGRCRWRCRRRWRWRQLPRERGVFTVNVPPITRATWSGPCATGDRRGLFPGRRSRCLPA